ncbi:hypothetical protein CMI37_23485 [Candidatus Pacearchaeota archaeon]|nr:hypothetical protein [Candidatus Pacearchaeota archaeon]
MASEEKTTKGNPDPTQQAAEDMVFGSSEAFFEGLDGSVNGAVVEHPVEPVEVTQDNLDSNIADTSTDNPVELKDERENELLKKRYSDSSREAQNLKAQLDELKPFVPVLNAMKEDSGLVDHVRNYLVTGGKPSKNIKDQLGLGEDFLFDSNEAMMDGDSDSAKVLNHYVNSVVNKRVSGMLDQEKQKSRNIQNQINRTKEEQEFKDNHKMSDTQFQEMVDAAKSHKLSLEDIHLILNRDKVAGNVARSTRNDMLKQMKNVKGMPASVSGTNSAKEEKSLDDEIFDGLLSSENNLDNMFGEDK